MCFDALDWATVAKDISADRSYYAGYELLVSIYNPNRVDLNATSVTGVVHYPVDTGSPQEVGTVTFSNFFAKAGCITDTIGMLSLNTDRWSTLDMGGAYHKGHLVIGIDLSLRFEVIAHGVPMFQYKNFEMERMVIDVNGPSDRTYCLCHNETTRVRS